MSIINSVRGGANDNVCKAIYRRGNEKRVVQYFSKNNFKKRETRTINDQNNTIDSGNLSFKIVRQIKNSKPTKTIYKIENQKYIFT